jgi:predicted nucleotidyltransferase
VILFGSLVRGNYAPGSDADILIELSDDERNWRERIPEYLQAFSGCPIPVEVFPFTEAEVRSAIEKGDLFITSIVQHGRELGMPELEITNNGE